MLICDVAVGKQYQTWQHQPHFTDPPRGYDSVLGMKETGENPSAFKVNFLALGKKASQSVIQIYTHGLISFRWGKQETLIW